jgi:glycine/D-amino acid oxidase-like deaminating enzyme
MSDKRRVLVVGAGIVGASIAWHLARAGARVTVVDAAEPGGVVTRASFGWINASWGNAEPYMRLRMLAMEEWRKLERELPGVPVAWTGGLLWDIPPDQLHAFVAGHRLRGYAIRVVGRTELQRIEPYLAATPAFAAYADDEGAVEPAEAAQALVHAAKARGAAVMANCWVRGLRSAGNCVTGVETETGVIAADDIVVAAGSNTNSLAESAGVAVPLRVSPSLLVWSRPTGPLINGLVLAPEMHIRQARNGRVVAAADFTGDPAECAAALFARMQAMIRGGSLLKQQGYAVGNRPIPMDGFPIIGGAPRTGGLYLAVAHSGVTLAPAVGWLAAREILTGERHQVLLPYGLDRFGSLG